MATTKNEIGDGALAAIWIGGIVGVLLLFAILGSRNGTGTSRPSAASGKSVAACTHWNNVKGDVIDGVLSYDELRSKVAEVRGSASTAAVEQAAKTLLAGVTTKSRSQILQGYNALESACN